MGETLKMTYKAEYERWLNSPALTQEQRAELEAIKDNETEIKERFFAPLEFGTAGLRGIMGMGLRRMNIYIIRQATRALGELILKSGEEKSAVVCFDCRINSAAYAKEAACVLAACGIRVYLFDELRPTPELSFAIRELGATSGINITASHNPKEYNGYKVYWSDGAQLPPEHAAQVAAAMEAIDPLSNIPSLDYNEAVSKGLIELIGSKIDEKFLENVMAQSVRQGAAAKADIKIVYTPFNGAGAKLVPEALKRLGVKRLYCVEEQMLPDGSFPTAKNPNPEFPEGFEYALRLAEKKDADIIIGSDPDSDRIGVLAKEKTGGYRLLSGNQVGVLFLDYIINARRDSGTLPENAAALKSIVSSEMARSVAERNGVHMDDTFTGFKFLAERMKYYQNGEKTVLFAYEEAIGYSFGTFVRDKDAVTASMMAAEMASFYALQGLTLIDRLEELYKEYGYYAEKTVNLVMPGLDGLEKMKRLMAELRGNPPSVISAKAVIKVRDYLTGKAKLPSGELEALPLVGSDVLYFELEGGSRLVVRPSGTEPKIKVYILVRGETAAESAQLIEGFESYALSLAKD
jgi:phosphoglucomutase